MVPLPAVACAPGLLARLRALAVLSLPLECCGVLGGRRAAAARGELWLLQRLVPLPNRAGSPDAFAIDPVAFLAAERALAAAGSAVLGFFHSHPSGDPEPSARDRDAAWPGTLQAICAVREGRPRTPRVFLATRAGLRRLRLDPWRPVPGPRQPGRASPYCLTPASSTSKTRVALPGMSGGLPARP